MTIHFCCTHANKAKFYLIVRCRKSIFNTEGEQNNNKTKADDFNEIKSYHVMNEIKK